MKSLLALIIMGFLLMTPVVLATAEYDVVIVRGDLPIDSIVAQVYTQNAGIPLVTISEDGLNEALRIELQGYVTQGNDRALIIGGEAAVSKRVETALLELKFDVTRIWDWNRYGTSARVARNLWSETRTVVVTNGDQQGSLLGAARVAIESGGPLLLTQTSELPQETKQVIQDLGVARIILIGNVTEAVRSELAALGGVEETRIKTLRTEEPSGTSIFVIGAVIGALFLFVASSLIGTGILKRNSEIPYSVLQDDEQILIDTILTSGGIMKQQDLPKKTGFSRPKVSRLVSELMDREVIEKEGRGKTYVIKMRKGIRK